MVCVEVRECCCVSVTIQNNRISIGLVVFKSVLSLLHFLSLLLNLCVAIEGVWL